MTAAKVVPNFSAARFDRGTMYVSGSHEGAVGRLSDRIGIVVRDSSGLRFAELGLDEFYLLGADHIVRTADYQGDDLTILGRAVVHPKLPNARTRLDKNSARLNLLVGTYGLMFAAVDLADDVRRPTVLIRLDTCMTVSDQPITLSAVSNWDLGIEGPDGFLSLQRFPISK